MSSSNSPLPVWAWVGSLGRRFGCKPVAVCLEQSREGLTYLLLKYPFLHLFPVHPSTSARYREAFRPSGSKSDPGDTGLLLDLLLHHRDRLRQLDPDTPQTRELQMLVETRRRFVNHRTQFSNSLTAVLKLYFPQVLECPAAVAACAAGEHCASSSPLTTADRRRLLEGRVPYSSEFRRLATGSERWRFRGAMLLAGSGSRGTRRRAGLRTSSAENPSHPESRRPVRSPSNR